MNSEVHSSSEFLSQIAELKTRWDAIQPLSPENERRLWQKLRLEWNYHSNHIEGNTLTYGETELLIIQGKTTGQHELREYEEMKAHDLGIQHVRSLAADERPITEADIRDLNRIILKEPFWKECHTADGQPTRKQIIPGQYKTLPNNVRTVTGEMFMFSSPEATPGEMSELTEWFRSGVEEPSCELVAFLATFHHRFSVIHPFDDGNGRTMRLLVNYALLRKGYVPIVVRTESKKEYLGALGAADAGNLKPFAEFIGGRIADALDLGVRAANGESIEEPEDWQKEMRLFVQDHVPEPFSAPERSFEVLRSWFCEIMSPLLNEIMATLKPLERLFESINCSLQDLSGKQLPITPEVTAKFAALPHTEATASVIGQKLLGSDQGITFHILLSKFSAQGVDPFDIKTGVRTRFAKYRYDIQKDGGKPIAINLRYDRHLRPDVKATIVRQIGKYIFDQVKVNQAASAHK